MADTKPVTIMATAGTRARLHTRLEAEAEIRKAISSRFIPEDGSRQALALMRTAKLAAIADERAAGRLLDTIDLLATAGLLAELAARDWNIDWPPLDDDAPSPSRWPGSRDGGYPEPIPVRFPTGAVAAVQAACWHVSKDAIRELRAWRDDVPGVLPLARVDPGRYEDLAGKVVVPGEVWRSALTRAISTRPSTLQG